MYEAILLMIEKELHEAMLDKYHQQDSLAFKQVGEKTYRVYNKATGRFHNLELGLDEAI